MDFSSPITEIIKVRRSKRDYLNTLFNHEMIEKIETILAENHTGPFGNSIQFKLIEKLSAKTSHKVKLGTYGFISGARYFIAGAIDPEKPLILEDYGFLLEKIILYLTDSGLGTCWLGGTFNRNDFRTILGDDPHLVVPAITPVGFPTKSNSLREQVIRWGASSNNRKSWEELFFNEKFGQPLSHADAGEYTIPLEMLRLAPSASNKQPWRVVKTNDSFHFFLFETPGYDKMIKAVKLQRIDMGIAMAHFEITCNEKKLSGKWKILEKPENISTETQYLVSWEMECKKIIKI